MKVQTDTRIRTFLSVLSHNSKILNISVACAVDANIYKCRCTIKSVVKVEYWGPGKLFLWLRGTPITTSGGLLQDREPLNLITALHECKIKKMMNIPIVEMFDKNKQTHFKTHRSVIAIQVSSETR